jgi:hypothetical protein
VRPARNRADQPGFLRPVLPPAGVGAASVTASSVYVSGQRVRARIKAVRFHDVFRRYLAEGGEHNVD